MRSTLIVCLAFGTGLAFVALRGVPAAPPAQPGEAPATTLLIMLGEGARNQERWDGSVQLSAGKLVGMEDRHFSAGDAVKAGGSWVCVTRRDQVAPYADIHYTEMRPGSTPEVLHHAVGVYVTVEAPAAARVSVKTAQGNFDFSPAEIGVDPKPFLGGRATVRAIPTVERLSTPEYEDDEPSIAVEADGSVAVAWVAYRGEADRVLVRRRASGAWSQPEEATTQPGDIFRTSLVAAPDGSLWAFWSQRDKDRWHLWGRKKHQGAWQAPERLSGDGSATFHRAAAAGDGTVFVVWQSLRGGQSDIVLRALEAGKWSSEVKLSESPANDWEPAVAAGADGTAHVAWDTYDKGNYDIHYRSWRKGSLSPLRVVTSGARFQAHAAVAVDASNRPWLAWDESGINWGKDQGFLIPVPLAVPLHQVRSLRVVTWDGTRWMEPKPAVAEALPRVMTENAEHPQLLFSSGGALAMVFRHWTRRNARQIGSPMVWENYATAYDGARWSPPQPLPRSGGWIEKHAGLARDAQSQIWAAWMTDNRPCAPKAPGHSDIYCARLLPAPAAAFGETSLAPYSEPFEEAIPVHTNDAEDVKTIRAYTISSGGKQYKIYRGDMHRHTDISQDFKYDGSLIEVYRYGLDAAAFDYIAPTDHQAGFDQEYSWWQGQKLVDLFLAPGHFVPLFAFERSVRFPNGHRNVVWAQRGVRTLPIPRDEADGQAGAAKLFEYVRKTKGISMPHSSATAQGTDWRDNDPEVEPLIEIYQGYRNSYEYEGAPRAATTLNQHAQKSGWQPEGFWWNALAKGYRLGVQASSDHWSTHISYACLITESFTREGLMDAIRKRHTYAATDNIVLDFRARIDGQEHLMGDIVAARQAPVFTVRTTGTGTIKQIDLVKNRTFVYTTRPGARQAAFEYVEKDLRPGESWYYVRVLQEDGQLAWSSPIWVKR